MRECSSAIVDGKIAMKNDLLGLSYGTFKGERKELFPVRLLENVVRNVLFERAMQRVEFKIEQWRYSYGCITR